MQQPLTNIAAERVVLSGLAKFGENAWVDVSDLIHASTFTDHANSIVFKILEHCINNHDAIDIPSIVASAKSLGFDDFFDQPKEVEYLRALFNYPAKLDNIRDFAKLLRKLEIAREYKVALAEAQSDLNEITGDESIDVIINKAENPVFELSLILNRETQDTPVLLGDNLANYINHLKENPADIVGISTGFPRYDAAIGGGLRRKTVTLIGARAKIGKSTLADNVAVHVTGKLSIPVLMLDTEMSYEDHANRLLANLGNLSIKQVETGKFNQRPAQTERILIAQKKLETLPYYYVSVAGRSFHEILSIMRRWIKLVVGFDENGRTKDCLIIYDYFKIMDSSSISRSMQEYQAIGFQISELHDFCVKYDVPVLTFVQLNRSGIEDESTASISMSDRLIWLCTSYALFKKRSHEEIAKDGISGGTHKFIPRVARHGPGLDDGDWINMVMDGSKAQIKELQTERERRLAQANDSGFEIDDTKE